MNIEKADTEGFYYHTIDAVLRSTNKYVCGNMS